MKACALRSGSTGNAIFVGDGATRLLVDAGVCLRDIEQSLASIEERAAELSGVLITHEHSDHIAGVGPLLRRYRIPLYATEGTWRAMQPIIGSIDEALFRLIEPGKPVAIGDLAVTGFATPHDATEPCGYRIETRLGAVAVLTDAGYLADGLLQAVAGCRAIFLEANYDQTMLLAGTYPAMLKQRILSEVGHLSNDDCAEAVCYLLKEGTEHFILSHLSKDNNYPELAMLTVGSKLQQIGAQPRDCRVDVARRFGVSEPCSFGNTLQK